MYKTSLFLQVHLHRISDESPSPDFQSLSGRTDVGRKNAANIGPPVTDRGGIFIIRHKVVKNRLQSIRQAIACLDLFIAWFFSHISISSNSPRGRFRRPSGRKAGKPAGRFDAPVRWCRPADFASWQQESYPPFFPFAAQ